MFSSLLGRSEKTAVDGFVASGCGGRLMDYDIEIG